METLFAEAAELAKRYNWPAEAEQLRLGNVPEGFAREVGKTIALFLERPVIGWAFHKGRAWADNYEKECRAHAKQLSQLRVLIAKISIAKRAEPCYNS